MTFRNSFCLNKSRLALFFIVILLFSMSQALAQTMIREIRIDGAQRIDPTTVLTYLDIKVGDSVDDEGLDRSLKSLFATGLFADVQLRQDESVLYVDIIENPVVSQIAFEGNDKLKDEELLAEISLRPRQVFTRTKIQDDVSRLYQIYRRSGRFAAKIEPKIIRLDQNRVNLVFEIDEGDITHIKGIRFVGNKFFDDDRLRKEISSKEKRWYKFLSSDDRYDPDRLLFDEELLRRFYLSEGFVDFKVLSSNAELSENKENFFVTITVSEGERYRVGGIEIDSRIRNFDGAVLKDLVSFEVGEWYDADEVRDVSDAMTDRLGDLQYAFVAVRPRVDRNREENTVTVVFRINESPRVFVERIDVKGNVRTLDKVIRREILLVEGDPFNRSRLSRSEQNIRDLGYFETVEVNTVPGSAPDKTVVEVDVSEQSTGDLSIGAGFSTSDGPLADFRIRERNLLGKGQDLVLGATVAGERTQFDLGFTEPYFLNRDVSAGFDLFHVTRDLQDESSFDQEQTGGALRLGYPLSEKWRQTLRYRIERNEITDIDVGASRFITEQEGERLTSAVSQRLSYTDLDSTLFPTTGLTAWLDTELAGLGGDAKYVSGRTGASYYYPVYEKSVVLNVLGEVGHIVGILDEEVQINERFFLGGTTLRGFESAGVGPRDISTNDSLGGNSFYRGTVELSFPVGLPEELGVKGHAFTDFGSVFDLDDDNSPFVEDTASLRAAAGVGASWRSPFGPLRVDLAFPYLKEDFDEEEAFRFNFGTRF